MTWRIVIGQAGRLRGPKDAGRTTEVVVDHCPTVRDAVRSAQRAYPGWTALYAERLS